MSRYRMATFAILAALPLTVLAACQPGSSSTSGAPAPAPVVATSAASGGSNSSAPADPTTTAASGDSGGTGNAAFCQQFTTARADILTAGNSDGKSVDDVKSELQQVIDSAPADIKDAVTTIVNANIALLVQAPNAEQLRLDPSYPKAEQSYQSWATSNCG